MAVANPELRFPFSGPERLALIRSKWFMTDINLFFDAGLAWYGGDQPLLKISRLEVIARLLTQVQDFHNLHRMKIPA
jgi:hypothetical protein